MPEQERQRQVHQHGRPHGQLKVSLRYQLFADLAAQQVKPGELPAVNQRSQPHDAQKSHGIHQTEHEHGAFALLTGSEGADQYRGHGEFPARGLQRRGHQPQCGSGQQCQRQRTAQVGQKSSH